MTEIFTRSFPARESVCEHTWEGRASAFPCSRGAGPGRSQPSPLRCVLLGVKSDERSHKFPHGRGAEPCMLMLHPALCIVFSILQQEGLVSVAQSRDCLESAEFSTGHHWGREG